MEPTPGTSLTNGKEIDVVGPLLNLMVIVVDAVRVKNAVARGYLDYINPKVPSSLYVECVKEPREA